MDGWKVEKKWTAPVYQLGRGLGGWIKKAMRLVQRIWMASKKHLVPDWVLTTWSDWRSGQQIAMALSSEKEPCLASDCELAFGWG